MRQLKITNNITSRESLALDKYLVDIGRIDLLTTEEEAELARRIRNGDDEALKKLTKANLRFVVSVAKQYQNQGLSLPDLINEGNVGLMKAARRFDETKGFKFISYAVWWIRQSILQAIVEYSRMVRLPLNKMTAYNKVNAAWNEFVQLNEREPTHEELAEILDVEPKDIANLLKGANKHVSVDAPLSDEEGAQSMLDLMTLGDEDSPDLKMMEESVRKEVVYGLEILSPREINVITAYYGLDGNKPMSLDEISDMYDLSKERVRQIRDRAIRRMRKSITRTTLRTILE
ncbi:MAG: RNA polymerase sigma factor RpoD/SigA [Saprospiraceae bacterium]|nr:MAG: RpoD subfamily RNA polymerase sigma-70 subunit [Bacteroidetes bacterium OLB9]MCO6464748.1 RNA polymerase sigma factor RpoD/SigA [Saprospiraceae bacterium]MCZ2339973.1 RNA polymerase sigma factor RpoD/SigA [Chitinophagales bacterium]